jgi:uncharacterized membrane protein HdeD (DUF308 family)
MFTYQALDGFAKHWWVLLVRGLLAVLFGAAAIGWPGPTLIAVVLLYGAYALVDGLTGLWVGAFAGAGWLVLSGVLGIGVGISTFIFPGITAAALFYLIAAWAIARGVFEIMEAMRLRKEISGEWALILGGICSIAFGVLLVANPVAGVLSLVWLISAYSLMFGVAMIFLAFRLRGLPRKLELHAGTA